MAEDEIAEGTDAAPKKKSKLPIIIGLFLAMAFGGGGFFAVFSGMILAPETSGAESDSHMEEEALPLPDVAFIPIDPIVINLKGSASSTHLKFHAQLEVEPSAQSDVAELLPRVVDVLNGYLRAVSVAELEEATALIKIRAQLLRRIQIVTGEGRVRDLLIMEFVLN